MTLDELRSNVSAYIAGLSMGGNNETVTNAIMNDVDRLAAKPADGAAPPKPAPDAMREAHEAFDRMLRRQVIEECINVRVLLTNLGGRSDDWIRGFDAGTNAFIDSLEKLLSSTPVPPADGAKRCDCQNPGICAHEGRCIDKPLSPSGTVAAEPVATVTDAQWERALNCAHEIMQRDVARHSMQEEGPLPSKKILDNAMQHAFGLLSLRKATPPVRGDRETIAGTPWSFGKFFHCAECEAKGENHSWRIHDANGEEIAKYGLDEKTADLIVRAVNGLSLPVQPGAGERWPKSFETAPRDGSWIIARCNDHSEIYRLRFNGEHWDCPEASTTFGDGLFLPNGDWIPDFFSRQAPHSGSEGGR